MDITPLVKSGQQIIQSYAGGRFKISGQVYESAVIVQPPGTDPWDAPERFADLAFAHFQALIDQADQIDVVLLGSGAKIAFFPPILREDLKQAGLIVDVMDTGAACRTYNVLMAEGRRVVAALFLL